MKRPFGTWQISLALTLNVSTESQKFIRCMFMSIRNFDGPHGSGSLHTKWKCFPFDSRKLTAIIHATNTQPASLNRQPKWLTRTCRSLSELFSLPQDTIFYCFPYFVGGALNFAFAVCVVTLESLELMLLDSNKLVPSRDTFAQFIPNDCIDRCWKLNLSIFNLQLNAAIFVHRCQMH